MIQVVATLLLLITILGFIVGMINPSIVVPLKGNKTRGKVFLIYGPMLIISLVLGVAGAPGDFEAGKMALDRKNYKSAVEHLSAIKPSDKDYSEAQRLLPEAKEKFAIAQQQAAEEAAAKEQERQEKKEKKQAEQAQREADAQAKKDQREAEEQAATQAKINNLPLVTATELAQAYEDNAVAADARFKDKKFRVSGSVIDIGSDDDDNSYIVLHGIEDNEDAEKVIGPRFYFDEESSTKLISIKKRMKITMVCTGSGNNAGIPVASDCYLL